jgi:hypothetical protein
MKKTLLFIGLLCLLASGLAQAADEKKSAGGKEKSTVAGRAKQACAPDLQKHCQGYGISSSGLPPGLVCLTEKRPSLTGDCRGAMDELERKVKLVRSLCQQDLDKYCSTVSPGGGAWVQCLNLNSASLRDGCRNGLQETF